MTEAEWLASGDPDKILKSLTSPGHRKSRLFACACCRRVATLITLSGIKAIEVAEQFADGNATRDELLTANPRTAPSSQRRAFGHTYESGDAVCSAIALWEHPVGCWDASQWAAGATTDYPAERAAQASLVRDIFGNPFRPRPTINPGWLTWNDGTVVRVAQAIYDDRAFERMPILADALEDASCDDADILNHCRSGVEHVRGCWVVDLLLGKE
jgi:hypothetical protein